MPAGTYFWNRLSSSCERMIIALTCLNLSNYTRNAMLHTRQ
jgi:hypothetical protein